MTPPGCLYDDMRAGRFPVLVSLPRHDLALAEAAVEGGADGIKVHINAYHRASGTTFGGFAAERPFLEAVSRLPVARAITIGQDVLPDAAELAAIAAMGFFGFNLYLHHARADLFTSPMRPILALAEGYGEGDLQAVRAHTRAIVEASVMPFAAYGQPLHADDLASYRRIVEATGLPVMVPTQKAIVPDDLPRLRAAGVHALLLGIVVTGDTPESVRRTTAAFVARRHALRS